MLFTHLVFFVIAISNVAICAVHDEVITPNAWGIARARSKTNKNKLENNQDIHHCPSVPCDSVSQNAEDALAATYYKKLVNYLFKKSRGVVDDFDQKHLIKIHLQITEQQLKALRESENVRDIDAIVSSVLEHSQDGWVVEAKETLLSWYDHLHYYYLRVINSHTLLLLSMASLFLGSVLLWRYLFRINLVAIVILNVLCVSLFFRYLECNRRLEFENIERTKSLTTAPNPCDRTTSFMFLSNYDSQKCTDYMMSIHGHERLFCDPIEVTADFALELLLKPFTKFMDNIGTFVDTSFGKHGLIKGTVVIAIVITAVTYWLRSFVKTFFGVLWMSRSTSRDQPTPKEIKESKETAPPSSPQPNVVNVHINLDPRAIGDYVQQVKLDEGKSQAALCAPPVEEPGSPGKKIENVADGYELLESHGDDGICKEEEKKKEDPNDIVMK